MQSLKDCIILCGTIAIIVVVVMLTAGCLNTEGDCQYLVDQAIADRDAEWQQRWNSNELMWKYTIEDRDSEWQQRWDSNELMWKHTIEDRDSEWLNQLEENDEQWIELVEKRDAEWEALIYKTIADRDAEWEYAISQNSDQQTLDFIMQVLPLLL